MLGGISERIMGEILQRIPRGKLGQFPGANHERISEVPERILEVFLKETRKEPQRKFKNESREKSLNPCMNL